MNILAGEVDGLQFLAHSNEDRYRAATLLTKEPRTITELQHLGSGDVFYDIGASTGLYSLYAARLGATVYAWEPRYESMLTNIKLNNFEGRIHLFPHKMMHLDEAVGLPTPTFIKLDVDGPEYDILKGGSSILSVVPRLQVECRPANYQLIDSLMWRFGLKLEYAVQLSIYNEKKEFNAVYRKNNR